ncbi:MAG: hypothetical protein ACYS8X_12040 [Planctomycetota bacterium]|jgi:hypothetical protein
MKAGAAERDVTPPIGLEITHPVRANVGVHDPLFVRALVLQDDSPFDGAQGRGTTVAIVCSDLIGADFSPCDDLRKRIAEEAGIENVLLNFSHPHSSRGFADYAELKEESDEEIEWAAATKDAYVSVVAEALGKLTPVSLKAGRAPVQVGFNRRVVADKGYVYMDDNKDGPVVPWTNVLLAERPDGSPMAILFEHAAHPVIVPNDTALVSADYPGAAVARIREALGDSDVIAMFAQGCQGNINGYPLRSSHENADAAGRKLGDAVLAAMATAEPIVADVLQFRTARTELPMVDLPPWRQIEPAVEAFKTAHATGDSPWVTPEVLKTFIAHFEKLQAMLARSESPPPWVMEATILSLGDEWGVVAVNHECFCQYELWIDARAPFAHNMTMALTNGATGYIATDEALAMGTSAGYEASCLPDLGSANVMTRHYGPPGVGAETVIKDLIASLWA